jgi:hypothetical protein
MSVTTLKLSGKEYVLLSKKEYERLTSAKEDRADAALARKAMKKFRAGKLGTIAHETLKRQLGI